MKDTNLLEEYVLNDQGAVFQGSSDHIGAKVWNFAQVIFEPVFDVWTIAFFFVIGLQMPFIKFNCIFVLITVIFSVSRWAFCFSDFSLRRECWRSVFLC